MMTTIGNKIDRLVADTIWLYNHYRSRGDSHKNAKEKCTIMIWTKQYIANEAMRQVTEQLELKD